MHRVGSRRQSPQGSQGNRNELERCPHDGERQQSPNGSQPGGGRPPSQDEHHGGDPESERLDPDKQRLHRAHEQGGDDQDRANQAAPH